LGPGKFKLIVRLRLEFEADNKDFSKSLFKMALDCPTKLFYTGKPEYESKEEGDSFLEALAQGGYQVNELFHL